MIYNLDIVETESMFIQYIDIETVSISYKNNVVLSLEQAKEDYIVYDMMTKKSCVKRLILNGTNTAISKEARAFILEENYLRSELTKAEAIVLFSQAQKLVGNLYYTFAESFYPIKLFCKEKQARAWLKSIQ